MTTEGTSVRQADQQDPYAQSLNVPVAGLFTKQDASGFSRHYARGSFAERVSLVMPLAYTKKPFQRPEAVPNVTTFNYDDSDTLYALSKGIHLRQTQEFKESYQLHPPIFSELNDQYRDMPGVHVITGLTMEVQLPALCQNIRHLNEAEFPTWPNGLDLNSDNADVFALWSNNVCSRIFEQLKVTLPGIGDLLDYPDYETYRMAIQKQALENGVDKEYTSRSDALQFSRSNQTLQVSLDVPHVIVGPAQTITIQARSRAAQQYIWSAAVCSHSGYRVLDSECGEVTGNAGGQGSQMAPYVLRAHNLQKATNGSAPGSVFSTGDIGVNFILDTAFVPSVQQHMFNTPTSFVQHMSPMYHAERFTFQSTAITSDHIDLKDIVVDIPHNMCVTHVVLGATDSALTHVNSWCAPNISGLHANQNSDRPVLPIRDDNAAIATAVPLKRADDEFTPLQSASGFVDSGIQSVRQRSGSNDTRSSHMVHTYRKDPCLKYGQVLLKMGSDSMNGTQKKLALTVELSPMLRQLPNLLVEITTSQTANRLNAARLRTPAWNQVLARSTIRPIYIDVLLCGYVRQLQSFAPDTGYPGPLQIAYGPPTVDALLKSTIPSSQHVTSDDEDDGSMQEHVQQLQSLARQAHTATAW